MTTPEAANKRFVVGHNLLFNYFADVLRTIPGLEDRVGENNDDGEKLTPARFATEEVDEVFHFKYRTLRQTAEDTVESLLKIEKA